MDTLGFNVKSDGKSSPMSLIFTDLIRIGNDFDGGYVLPRSSIDGVNTLISFGVGSNWTFESFIEKLLPTIKIYGFDHTVSLSYFFRKKHQEISVDA